MESSRIGVTFSETRLGTWRTPVVVIIAGCVIATVGYGVRSVFGLFLAPMTTDLGWSRETFALALAIQNLMWGVGTPVAGALADRYGPRYVLAAGTIIYALGTWGMASSASGLALQLTAGLLVGTGIAFSSFSLVLAAMARTVGPERRSVALGLGTAASSFGQVLFSPVGQGFISSLRLVPGPPHHGGADAVDHPAGVRAAQHDRRKDGARH